MLRPARVVNDCICRLAGRWSAGRPRIAATVSTRTQANNHSHTIQAAPAMLFVTTPSVTEPFK